MSKQGMQKSQALFERACKAMPGGVNSPVRAFQGVGGETPFFVARGEGPRMTDVDGHTYIDYIGSWGPLVLGHRDPRVMAAVETQLGAGLGFGTPTELEVRMAEKLQAMVPSLERVRLVNSGTEATMSAVRVARAATGRDLVVKFEGCYHGHVDSLLVKAGSGALTLGVPSSPGVPEDLAQHTLTLPFNDIQAAQSAFAEHGSRIACVLVEPVAGNMSCVPPVPGFLETLRQGCDTTGAALIFDEVMTGFRVAAGGAQAHYGVTPDITALGKIIGGGLPVGAFGGRTEFMDRLAPTGPVYQAGTLAGNPVAMAAGLATLEVVAEPGFHDRLSARTAQLTDGARERASKHGVPLVTHRAGGMFGVFFTDRDDVTSLADVQTCDLERFKRFFHLMLERGVYLAPSAFEAGFVSIAHDETVVTTTLEAMDAAFAAL